MSAPCLDSASVGSDSKSRMTNPLADERLDWALLDRYDFDRERFEREREAMLAGTMSAEAAIVTGKIEPAGDAVVDVTFEDEAIRELGAAALARGEVASVVLNGGMATRFGGVVKGVVEVFDGLSFLQLKARDVRRASERHGATIPFVMMNSFATEPASKEHLPIAENVLAFAQSISVRLTEDQGLFIGDDGKPSYHAPGHGDFFRCIRRSGVLAELSKRGVKYVLFSNVDNLGATVDPSIVGHHIQAGRPMSAEVTQKQRTASGAWDKGGAPAYVDGHLELVEGFRFPPDFAQESLPDFSTNNMVFSVDGIDRELPLARHVVKKKVDGRTAVQLESIACEASAILDVTLLRVPREGAHGRFFPVKEPQDLDAMRDRLRERLED